MANDNHLVELPGHGRFWLLLDDDGSGPLAPLDHCDENGDVTFDAAFGGGDSYAHLCANGEIKRYGTVIARREDLVEVTASAEDLR